MQVKPKKHLGQHFLTDENIARKIAETLPENQIPVLEVGPGTGVLTKYLHRENRPLFLAEIDAESIEFLKNNFDFISEKNFRGDFLKEKFEDFEEVMVIGNFPYNISSQILFAVVDHYEKIPVMAGMFQKEVAERTAAKPRTKAYGILSVLVQAYYDVEYLFTVNENVFNPPPKVKSGVIKLERNKKSGLEGNEILFKQIVKAGFSQRRKKLSNSLKVLGIPEHLQTHEFLDKRAEELSVADFIDFAKIWRV